MIRPFCALLVAGLLWPAASHAQSLIDNPPAGTPVPGELIVTTEKDLARNSGGSHVWALRTQLHLESGASYLKQRLEDLITA